MEGSNGQKAETRYTVQVEETLLRPLESPAAAGEPPKVGDPVTEPAWVDVATVGVPARSHRRTAIAKALGNSGREAKPGQRFRVLDEDAATVLTARERQPVTPTIEFA